MTKQDNSDHRSAWDESISMRAKVATAALEKCKLDDTEPITDDWWMHIFGADRVNVPCHFGDVELFYWLSERVLYLLTAGSQTCLSDTVKTRGDLRELCRLLGVKMK